MNMRNLSVVCLTALLAVCGGANAQENSFFQKGAPIAPVVAPYKCNGPVNLVTDVADENLHTTKAAYITNPGGGGEGGQLDKKPILTTSVTLRDGQCLDAHLSAIVGGPIYGVSSLALFQVTLTGPVGPVHMYGHYETPYGTSSPAVALGAEPDVDMLGANFIQHVGTGAHDVPPGNYKVNVWWAGSPGGPGAIGAAFVLKLYSSK